MYRLPHSKPPGPSQCFEKMGSIWWTYFFFVVYPVQVPPQYCQGDNPVDHMYIFLMTTLSAGRTSRWLRGVCAPTYGSYRPSPSQVGVICSYRQYDGDDGPIPSACFLLLFCLRILQDHHTRVQLYMRLAIRRQWDQR